MRDRLCVGLVIAEGDGDRIIQTWPGILRNSIEPRSSERDASQC
jgi:hypothetical protein